MAGRNHPQRPPPIAHRPSRLCLTPRLGAPRPPQQAPMPPTPATEQVGGTTAATTGTHAPNLMSGAGAGSGVDGGVQAGQPVRADDAADRSEEHTPELQSLMRNPYAVPGLTTHSTYTSMTTSE